MKLYITKITIDNPGSVTGHKLTDDDVKEFKHNCRSKVYSELSDAGSELDCTGDYIDDVYLDGYYAFQSTGANTLYDLKPGDYCKFDYVHEDYEGSMYKLTKYDISITFTIIAKEVVIDLE